MMFAVNIVGAPVQLKYLLISPICGQKRVGFVQYVSMLCGEVTLLANKYSNLLLAKKLMFLSDIINLSHSKH